MSSVSVVNTLISTWIKSAVFKWTPGHGCYLNTSRLSVYYLANSHTAVYWLDTFEMTFVLIGNGTMEIKSHSLRRRTGNGNGKQPKHWFPFRVDILRCLCSDWSESWPMNEPKNYLHENTFPLIVHSNTFYLKLGTLSSASRLVSLLW